MIEGTKPRATVLCVDDDCLHLNSLSRILGRRGYCVCLCERADQALSEMKRERPDVAIVDIMMPGMGGLDLAERIRSWSDGRIPVVVLTALTSDEAYYQGRERGASWFLTKPCEPEKLIDVIEYLVGNLDEKERQALRERL